MTTWILLILLWNAEAGSFVGTPVQVYNDLPRCLAAATSERFKLTDATAQVLCWPDVAPIKTQ